MKSLLLLLALFSLTLADQDSIHEAEVSAHVQSGRNLIIKIPAPTTIWYRKFQDGRPDQYVEACSPYLDISNKWRSGILGKTISPQPVSVDKDGTLVVPKVTPADSAQYSTHYEDKNGADHFLYFNVIVGDGKTYSNSTTAYDWYY